MGNLTQDFDKEEFACKCGCGYDDINIILVERLQIIHNALGEPLSIVSGCRCEKHNSLMGGRINSSHMRGMAADVLVKNSNFRYKFLKQAFKIFYRIEIPDGPWIHVDMDDTLPQEVCFTK